jgi:O-antigen/teichoic acid export membrane protein
MNLAIGPTREETKHARGGSYSAGLWAELARLQRWAPSGVLALLDQGLISGSNFVLGVSLARTAGPDAYGAYMVIFAVFLLIANVHQALLLEPTNVLAFSLFPDRNDRYFRTVLLMHAIFTGVFLAAASLVWLLAPRVHMRYLLMNALAGMVIATPCVLLFWLARCFSYLDFAPGRAVRGSLLYTAVMFTGLLVSIAYRSVTPLGVFICTAFAALCATLFLLIPYRMNRPMDLPEPKLREVWRRHWRFGRWGLSTVGLSWAQTNSISFISGSLLGLRATGGLNALIGLLLPMFQVLSAITRVALPRIARISAKEGVQSTKSPVVRVAFTSGILTGAYWLALLFGHNLLLHWTYGQRFASYAYLAPVIGLHLVACAVITACEIGFNSIQSPRSSFRIKLLMVAVMVPVNTAITWRFGLIGAAVGVPGLSAATAACMAFKLRRVWRDHRVFC